MPDEINDDQWQEIEGFLFAGQKIKAIKVFRGLTGTGLKEAKDAMDKHEQELRKQFPDKFIAKAGSGCATVIFLALGVTTTILVHFFG